jgi:hypothetical protein
VFALVAIGGFAALPAADNLARGRSGEEPVVGGKYSELDRLDWTTQSPPDTYNPSTMMWIA